MKYLFILTSVLFLTSAASAQVRRPMGNLPPGRTLGHESTERYADSAAFEEAFKELYPLIKPTPTIRERTEIMFDRMVRMYKARGVDSAAAHDSVMKVIDPEMDRKLIYDVYRGAFTAKEISALATFFKSPVGKHYLEVEDRIVEGRTRMIEQYVTRTISSTVMPMEKPMERHGTLPPGRMRLPGQAPTQLTPADSAHSQPK